MKQTGKYIKQCSYKNKVLPFNCNICYRAEMPRIRFDQRYLCRHRTSYPERTYNVVQADHLNCNDEKLVS